MIKDVNEFNAKSTLEKIDFVKDKMDQHKNNFVKIWELSSKDEVTRADFMRNHFVKWRAIGVTFSYIFKETEEILKALETKSENNQHESTTIE